jgi:hypothetical protein
MTRRATCSSCSSAQVPTVQHEDELRTLAAQPIGAAIFVEETQESLLAVGNVVPHSASKLWWMQQCVWIPDHALRRITMKHPIFTDHLAAIRAALDEPIGIYTGEQLPNGVLILALGDTLRKQGLLQSRSVTFVDAVIEFRSVTGGMYLRLFHFAPASRNRGGIRLWP